MHCKGVTHRDLKPENVLLRSCRPLQVLVDFGLVDFDAGSLTTECGTGRYMGPGLFDGSRDHDTLAIDIWALGVTALVLYVNRLPPLRRG